MGTSLEIYFSYASEDQEDKALREGLERQLGVLVQQGLVNIWHADKTLPGEDTESKIITHLNNAHIILLLVSESFISSADCMRQVERAMERHEAEEATVIPILLRPVDWKYASFSRLKPLPQGGEFVTLSQNRDKALSDIAKGIRLIVEEKEKAQQEEVIQRKNALLATLKRLNYENQKALFWQCWHQHQAGAFLIHGAPGYGQIWLLNRLIWQFHNSSTFQVLPFNFQRRGRGRSVDYLWSDLAKQLGLRNPFPIDSSTRQEIVKRFYKRWQTQTIILKLDNLRDAQEQDIDQFLQEFWQPLVKMAKNTAGQFPRHYFLMFLIDNNDCIDNWSIPVAKQVDPTWEPDTPFKLKKLAELSKEILEHWIETEFESLPTHLKAQDILDNSDDDTPEGVLDAICRSFDYQWQWDWHDLVTIK